MSTTPNPRNTSETPDATPAAGRVGLPWGLGWRLLLARAVLIWERIWPAIWPVAGLLGLFLALALFDILPLLPGWLHALLLAVLGLAAILGAYHGLRRVALPGPGEARRRLELDSGIAHRPLQSLGDAIAAGGDDPDAARLWEIHRRRLRAQLKRLRLGAPRAGLAAVDPLALRGALVLVLVVAVVAGRHDWPGNLERALSPRFTALAAGPPASLDVWVNPPAYTGQPPLFLDTARDGEEPLSIPTGSTILAQVQGGASTPNLTLGDQTHPFTAFSAEAYRVSAEVHEGDRLVIAQGKRTLADWRLALRPDAAPTVEFLAPPGRGERGALRLNYGAGDDYGLTQVTALIRRIDNPKAEPIELELGLPGVGLKQADGVGYFDLTPHPWAGLAVMIRLFAEDAIGQTGESDSVLTVLPERIFNHPVARALVELRKQLTLNPDARLPVVRALSEIYQRPDHFFNDLVVALAIRAAERRLVHDRSATAVGQVQQLLWDTALHIEDGELAIAERDLREIQKALMDALAQGADDAEIQRLMDQLQNALNRFLEAMAEQLREQMAEGGELEPLPPNAQILQGKDLQRLIDQARQLAQTGSREAARDRLARLQELLENLRANPFARAMDDATRNAYRMMQDMESLLQRQEGLLNRSYQRSQRGDLNDEGRARAERDGREDAIGQEGLRRELGAMMRRLGDILGDFPRSLGRAEQSMREARDALGENRSGDAVGPQTRALDQLQQGLQSMADRFLEQMGNMAAGGNGQLNAAPGTGRDPLGRRPGSSGMEALEGVEIPDQMEIRRAREILDELRRRRGERDRPVLELDYIDRLLRQF